MVINKFDPSELTIVAMAPGRMGAPDIPIYKYPVSSKMAYSSAYEGKALWQITSVDMIMFTPRCNPDNIARGMIMEGSNMHPTGGADMFGIEWEYIPKVGGSMVRPGKPFISDANELEEKVVWPDIDSWDFEGNAHVSAEYLSNDKYIMGWFLNGWFERLISFMEFEGAVLALIDEEQKEAVKAFFNKLSDLYIRIFDKYLTYFPQIDAFTIHDDWGAQKDTFFSPATVEEMIVPYMKKVTDFLHAKGKQCDLHSCGNLIKQVPNIIAAGWDSWSPQLVNDTGRIYELYGDKILLGVSHGCPDIYALSEEEQRKLAVEYAEKYCNPGVPSTVNFYNGFRLPDPFREELYKQSRIRYCG